MCDKPLIAWRVHGSAQPVFSEPPDYAEVLRLQCRRCMGCRIRNRQDFTLRGVLEASMQRRRGRETWFLTLTQSPEFATPWDSVNLRDPQLFIKRVRKHFGQKFLYQLLGEYGGETLRPHYHATFFGLEIDDLQPVVSRPDCRSFTSETLTRLWGRGNVGIARATEQTIAYVASHQTKDLSGRFVESGDWMVVDQSTGEVVVRTPPFRTQSTRPAIGLSFFEAYGDDLWRDPRGIFVEGRMQPIPDFFLRKLAEVQPDRAEELAEAKRAAAMSEANLWNTTDERLAVRAEVRAGRFRSKRDARSTYAPEPRVLLVDGDALGASHGHG